MRHNAVKIVGPQRAAFAAGPDASTAYRENVWKGQAYRPEVWTEKSAVLGLVVPACRRWRVPYAACRGSTATAIFMPVASGSRSAQRTDADRLLSRRLSRRS